MRIVRWLHAAAAALLLGPALATAGTAVFVGTDNTSQGTWKGAYGADGFNVIQDTESYPAYASVVPGGHTSANCWGDPTSDPRGLQKAGATTDRIAACWYSQSSFSIAVDISDGQTHALSLYSLDFDHVSQQRKQRIEIRDTATNALLSSYTANSMANGLWMTWNVSGSVTIVLVNLNGGSNAVVSGLFFDPPRPPQPPATATFVSFDDTTQGNWKNVYGADGYRIFNDAQNDPAYASLALSGQTACTWSDPTGDVRALQRAGPTNDRVDACIFSGSSFSIDVPVTGGGTHAVSLYMLDHDGYAGGRSVSVELRDSVTNALLDTRAVSGFGQGRWATWNISGRVTIVYSNTNPASNAVLAGIFFGPPPNVLVSNGSFEAGGTATGAYLYAPADQGPWIFGGSGVTGANSGFTSSNTAPTDGRLAAFLQNTGYIEQTGFVDSAGSYAVTFRAVQRANHGGQQAVQISIDGQRVSAFPVPTAPISGIWLHVASPPVALAAGPHVLKIEGLWSVGGDSTAFIDDVRLVRLGPTPMPTQIAGSFEEWQIGAQNYHFEAGGQPWSFPGNAGLVANGSGLGNPGAPQGQQAAFVKAAGAMQQSWTSAGGSYQLRLKAAAMGGTAPTLIASIDGVAVGSWQPGAGYAEARTVVQLAAGPHTLRLTTSGGDAFVDDVQLAAYVDPGPPGAFNAFESGTPAGSISGVVHTKVAGAGFAVDIVALDAARTAVMTDFYGMVRIELLDGSDNSGPLDANGCRSSWAPVGTSTPVTASIDFADYGRKTVTLADPEAWRILRLRLSTPATGTPTTVACASDAFANRPATFASLAATDASAAIAGTARSLANVSASGGVVHKAGRPFSVRAAVLNAAGGSTAGYAGTPMPTVSACAGSACDSAWTYLADENGSFTVSGTQTVRYGKGTTWTTRTITGGSACSNGVFGDPLVGTVKECQLATLGALTLTPTATAGVIDRNGTYSEAGSFALQLIDADFASVDAADGSSAAERTIASAIVNVGRFVPDHFDVVALAPPVLKTFDSSSCTARSFTYIGQPFGYASAAQARVLARNAAGGTTTLYRGAKWKLDPASIGQAFTPSPAAPSLDASAATPPTLTSNGDGTGLLVGTATDKLRFERPGDAPIAPFAASIALRWTAQDTAEAAVAGNGTIDSAAPLVFANIAFDAGNQFRFGALRLVPAYGSELVDLPVLIEAQYWDGQRMATNAADQCTAVPATAVAMGNYQRSLAACKTAVAALPASLASGRAWARLAKPGHGNSGSVDVSLQLGGAATGQTCQSVGAAAASTAAANLPWLQGRWNGAAAYDQNPATRASFGQYRSPIIFRREVF